MAGFDQALKVLVWERDGRACVRCGHSVDSPDIHHRCARGAGGANNREPWINSHENLLTLDRACHDWVEGNRDEAKEHGWLLRLEYQQVPEDVYVHYHDGVVYQLHGDFFRTPRDFWRLGKDVRALT